MAERVDNELMNTYPLRYDYTALYEEIDAAECLLASVPSPSPELFGRFLLSLCRSATLVQVPSPAVGAVEMVLRVNVSKRALEFLTAACAG